MKKKEKKNQIIVNDIKLALYSFQNAKRDLNFAKKAKDSEKRILEINAFYYYRLLVQSNKNN